MKAIRIVTILIGLAASTTAAQAPDFVWVFLNTNPDRPDLPKPVVDSLQRAHIANIERLASEGKLLAAGPFQGGGGMFVFRPTSIDTVKAWVATDPAVKAGRFLLEYLSYRPLVGSVCKVGKDYTMTNYRSIRLAARGSVDGAELVRSALTTSTSADTVIAAGSFGDAGGFLVYKNKVDEARFNELRAVKEGIVAVKERGLFIAKGSFCE